MPTKRDICPNKGCRRDLGHPGEHSDFCPCCEWRLRYGQEFCKACLKAAAEAPEPVTKPAPRPRSRSERNKQALRHLAKEWPGIFTDAGSAHQSPSSSAA